MAFDYLGKAELTTLADTLALNLKTRRLLKLRIFVIASGAVDVLLRFNGDSGNNYSLRLSADGAADSTSVTQSSIDQSGSQTTVIDAIVHVVNKSDKEKGVMALVSISNTTGAATVPNRREVHGKWDSVAAQITSVSITNAQAGDFGIGTRIEVWGSD